MSDSSTVRAKLVGGVRALHLRSGTFVALGLALGSVVLAWSDPWADEREAVMMVSTHSVARRVFPTLGDEDASKATIELQAAGKPLVRIVPGDEGGHQLLRDAALLGPVDPDAFDTLWSSLRMGTALRPVERGTKVRTNSRGFVRVVLPHATFTLELGDPATGVGIYGRITGTGESDEAWVLESELGWLLDQGPETWLARRLLPFEPESVDSVTFEREAEGEPLVLERGDDGFWRVAAGARPALLSTDAVEFKLGRLLRAQLDPLIEPDQSPDAAPRPSVVVTTQSDESRALLLLGECPGHPDRVVVDRGPGLRGCLPAELFQPWQLFDADGGMVEGRLIPHRYPRITKVELVQPTLRTLRREAGVWLLDEGDGQGSKPVSEDEVARWYDDLWRVEVQALIDESEPVAVGEGDTDASSGGEPDVAPEPAPSEGFVPEVELIVHADTKERVRVRCGVEGDLQVCVRDDGPRLRVLGALPRNLAFEAETFAERRLIEAGAGEVRELEIVAGESGEVVRQSVEQDMGVWRLESPEHVDEAAGALDEVRLETLIAILSSLRAEAWQERPAAASLRTITISLVPEQGPRRSVALTLHPDCVVEVEQRFAAVASADCAVLGEDILYDDPLRLWIDGARTLELLAAPLAADKPERMFLRREDGRFETVDGRPLSDERIEALLQGFVDWRSKGLRSGEPPTPLEWTLDLRRNQLPDVHAEVGAGWVRLRGADWYYVERETKPSEGPSPDAPIDFDPQALEVPGSP